MISQEHDSTDEPNSQESFESSSEEFESNESVDEGDDNDEIDSISSFDYVMNDFTVMPTTSSSPTEQILRQMVERQTPPPPFRLIFVNMGQGCQPFYVPQPHGMVPTQQTIMNYKVPHKSISNDENKKKKSNNAIVSTKRQEKTKKKDPNNAKCGCKSSNCIKLYCHCFQSGEFCASTCKCVKCFNTVEESKKRKGGKRKAAINEILKKKPNAFSTVTKK